MRDLREVAALVAACAETVLDVFETDRPDDLRPRGAVGAAWEFARGGERGKALRTTASTALSRWPREEDFQTEDIAALR
ncbi:putative immunity protein [Streptomyces galbus]|uniref:putative immunity protein n=1 Tax=Streptomyces galbus TaxID=33898 RepID=UPI0037B9AB56